MTENEVLEGLPACAEIRQSCPAQADREALIGESETLKEFVERDARRKELQKKIAALEKKIRQER